MFATQTLRQRKQKRMRVTLSGDLQAGVSVKDIILGLIAEIGVSGGVGYAIEYAGDTIAGLSMEARMTLCNMTIEAGSRGSMIAPDETTFSYLKGRPLAPNAAEWDGAVTHWKTLATDADAVFDREVRFNAADLAPRVSWGTTPEENLPIDACAPDPMTEQEPRAARTISPQSQLHGFDAGNAAG